MENSDWLGYIYSNNNCINFVPQKIQNLVIRDFLQKKNANYLLSTTEFNFDGLYLSLEEILKVNKQEKIVFYSTDLFPEDRADLTSKVLKLIDEGSLSIAFALEDSIVDSREKFEEIFKIKKMKSYSFQPKFQKGNVVVPFRDLRVQDRKVRQSYSTALNELLDHGQFLNGDQVKNFERQLSDFCQTRYSVGLSSGTDALYLALKALDIGKGDKVIIPCMSWISTAHAVKSCGAEPIFVDIKRDLTICEDSLEIMIDDSVKAVILVHFMGNICSFKNIIKLSKKYDFKIIEDCAQSFGAEVEGQRVGGLGDISCFSFNPMKSLSSLGEAGAICTNNEVLFNKIQSLRYCGIDEKESVVAVSLNYRMDSFQASILSINLNNLSLITKKREYLYNYYIKKLSPHFSIITGVNDNLGSKYGFTLELNEREKYIKELNVAGIETRIHHVPLMNEYDVYSANISDVKLGNLLKAKILNIPFHEKIDFEQMEYVTSHLISIKERMGDDQHC